MPSRQSDLKTNDEIEAAAPRRPRPVVFADHGVRFRVPSGWGLEVSEDGSRISIAMQQDGGTAFVLLTLDPDRPAPEAMADEALDAMRAEYPDLEEGTARATIAGHAAIGHDLDFITLDMGVSCAIRCFRTPRRTILVFEQWSDLDDEATREAMAEVARTLEETDG
jgi:hypothetical protein